MKTTYTSALRGFPRSDGERRWHKFLRAKGYSEEKAEGETPSEEKNMPSVTKARSTAVAPTYTAPKSFSYPEFTYGEYAERADVTKARAELENHTANEPSAYQSLYRSEIDALMEEISGRKPFSYDPEEDALYQKYKDEYIHGGRLAMDDAIGKASAMTGGYGNTYAQSVGQQAYQASLGKLGDIVPELYRTALERYTAEGKALDDRYELLSDREKSDYEQYLDSLSAYLEEKEYLTERYEAARKDDYGRYTDERDFAYDAYEADRKAGYEEYRDSVKDAQWESELAFQKRQYEDKRADQSPVGSDGGASLLSRSPQEPEQPDNIGGMKLTDSGLRTTVNGESQILWLAGDKYWVWRKDLGRYVEAEGFRRI